jgi:hypothetical protein
MKEVLTKGFWRSVKKTFYDALEEPPAEANVTQAPEGKPNDSSSSNIPSEPSPTKD